MAVATVVLLLACGIIVIQASPFDANANPNVNILKYRRNINANTNMNIIGRRNINGNANTNILSRRDINANANTNIIGRRNGIVEDDSLVGYEEGEILPAEKMRRRGDTTLAKIAVAAGDAVYEVLKEHTAEMNVNAANAVVEAVLNVLRRPQIVPFRRNYNSNSNTNIVGGRGGGLGGGALGGGPLGGAYGGGALGGGAYGIASGGGAPLYPYHPSGLAYAQGSGGHALGLSSGPGGYALAHGGRYADEEEAEAEDADDAQEGDHSLRDAAEEDVEEDEAAARRGWTYPIWGGNNNANANTNVLNGWRREHRRNVNANSNMNIISHRRAQG